MHGYRNGIEEVNGIIIGGEWKTGKIFRNNKQFDTISFIGDTDEEVMEKAGQYINKLKLRIGMDEYKRLYNDGFELRVYD
jgi:hypothetical protein